MFIEALYIEFSSIYNRLKNDQARYNLNLEVQLLLKQGQVEIDPTTFIADYKDSALIHRSVVEELNTNIKVWASLSKNIFLK